MKALLIAGTDTDVGKTILTTALAAYWQTYRSESLGLMKLIQTGVGDREIYAQLFEGNPAIEICVPLRFDAPVAPPIAAARENRTVDLAVVWQAFKALQAWVLIESLGGLGSPITDELTVADLARDWRLKTVLVVPVKLGAISAAVAHVALARQAGVDLLGIVLNCIQPHSESKLADWTPVDLIQSLTNVPILGTLAAFKRSH